MCELYQFTCDETVIDLEILFDGFNKDYFYYIEAEGIEFRPLDKVEHIDVNQSVSDSDSNWEENLPADYENFIERLLDSKQCTTKNEAFSTIRRVFFITDEERGKFWFYFDKTGKKCHMLSATAAGIHHQHEDIVSLPESRFGEATVLRGIAIFIIEGKICSRLISSETTYARYLVFKLSKDQCGFEAPLLVLGEVSSSEFSRYIYFLSPQTPVIRPKVGQDTHNQVNRPQIKSIPQQRNDGWMEVQICEFHTLTNTAEMIRFHFRLVTCGVVVTMSLVGLLLKALSLDPYNFFL